MAVTLDDVSRNVMCNAFTAQLAGGHIVLKNASGNTVAILIFHATTPFTAAVTGSAEAGGTGEEITPEDSVLAPAGGSTATNFALTNAAETITYATGNAVVATPSAGDIVFTPTNAFVATGTVSISSMIVTVPATCA